MKNSHLRRCHGISDADAGDAQGAVGLRDQVHLAHELQQLGALAACHGVIAVARVLLQALAAAGHFVAHARLPALVVTGHVEDLLLAFL